MMQVIKDPTEYRSGIYFFDGQLQLQGTASTGYLFI